jgi:hypothetical protein
MLPAPCSCLCPRPAHPHAQSAAPVVVPSTSTSIHLNQLSVQTQRLLGADNAIRVGEVGGLPARSALGLELSNDSSC